MADQPTERPMCRTREEAFQAGYEDAANDRPMSEQEIQRIAALWRPYYKPARIPA